MKKRIKLSSAALILAMALSLIAPLGPSSALAAETVVGISAPAELVYDANGGSAYRFSGGLARITQDGKTGYVDRTGTIVIQAQYDQAWDFTEGLAAVGQNGKFGAIDKNGKVVVPLTYDSIEPYSEGLAMVEKNGRYGFAGRDGALAIPLRYDDAASFSDGMAVVRQGKTYGAIDKTGAEAAQIKPAYDAVFSFTDGMAMVGLNGKYGFIDKTGKEIVAPQYDVASPFCEGLAKVAKNGKEGFIDRTGKVAVALKYEYANDFSGGLARVCTGSYPNDKYGYVDKTGKVVVPLEYEYADSFSEGLAVVLQNGEYSFIDAGGGIALRLDYDFARSFSDGLAAVSKDGMEGFIDKSGNVVVPLIYNHVYDFSDGLAWVLDGGSRGILQIDSGEVTKYIYDDDAGGASVALPLKELDKVTDRETAVEAVRKAVSGLTDAQKGSSTGIDLITLFAEEAISRAACATFGGGKITIDQANIRALRSSAIGIRTEIEKTLSDAGIATRRAIRADVKFVSEDSTAVTITIDPSFDRVIFDDVRVETGDFALSFSAASVKSGAADSPFVITTAKSGANPGSYSVTFGKPPGGSLKISLPTVSGSPDTQVIVNSGEELFGGKHNPVTNKLEAKIGKTGIYTVKANRKNFRDISGKPSEMQKAINLLASKGIINGATADTFDPDGTITRAQTAALMARLLSLQNDDAGIAFDDVARDDWFYDAVGSAVRHGIMNGVGESTFDPLGEIRKEQIVAIAARMLRVEMDYKELPGLTGTLGLYADTNGIPAWAHADVALATREGVVPQRADARFDGSAAVTRGDAAVILYRLYTKIW